MPILESRRLAWPDEAACAASARGLAGCVGIERACIELRGDLGAGKTTFVRHLLHALGVEGRIKSPTYALMEPYEVPAGGAVWHFDFYRFDDPQEWAEAGFRDLFASAGLKLVEWPDKAAGLLPPADLRIDIVADRVDTVPPVDAATGAADDGSTAGPRSVTFSAGSVLGAGMLP